MIIRRRSLPALFLAASAVAVLPGCASTPAPVAVRSATVAPPIAAAAALTPSIYMALASNVSLFAIRASELAVTRASDPQLRAAARQIIADQGGVGAQLSHAGRRVNLLPDAALPAPMAADLERLGQSPDFDREYRQLVGQALGRALAAHSTFESSGASPTLRMVARVAAPLTRRDVEALKR